MVAFLAVDYIGQLYTEHISGQMFCGVNNETEVISRLIGIENC